MMNKCYYCFSSIGEDGKCLNCGYDNSAYEPKAYHLPIGTVIGGRYIIGAVIGEGGFGITYSAFDKRMNSRCAVKEYYPRQISGRGNTDEERTRVFSISGMEHDYAAGLERFQNEAKQLAKFDGIRNIVNVKNYISENGTGYIIMNYVSGISLKELLNQRGGKLPADETFSLIEPLLRAISVIQRDGIIHRDISPDNIMYSEDKRLVLIDFGSAREYDSEKSMSVILKHGYAPPEQYSSVGKQGPWTDIYSVCATIYRMLTGNVPNEAMDRIDGTAAVKKPSELGIKLSQTREDAIMKGLEIEIEKRWQTADELYTALYLKQEVKKPFPWKTAAALSAAAVFGITAAAVIISRENDDSAMTSAGTVTTASETTVSETSSTEEEFDGKETIPNGYYQLNEDGSLFIDVDGILSENYWENKRGEITSVTFSDNVTAVGSSVFKNMKNLSEVTLSANIKEIGDYAFSGCTALNDFCFDNVEIIGEYAFSDSGLKKFSSGSSLKLINEYAFSGSALESVSIGESGLTVGNGAFSECLSLKTLNITNEPQLGEGAFASCSSLTELDLSKSTIQIPAECFMGCSSLKSLTLTKKPLGIEENAFSGCTSLEELTAVFEYDENETQYEQYPDSRLFEEAAIKKITSNVNISGFDDAEEIVFLDNPQHSVIVNGSDIRKIIVGNGITSVTVENAKNLESIELPDSISEAKYYYYNKSNSYYSEKNGKYSNSEIESFNRDYLTIFGELSLASKAKDYPRYGYSSEKESITVPDGFTSVHIDSYVITDLKLPDSVTSLILQNSKIMPAFENFPKSLKYLDMSNSLISSVNIPDSVEWFNFRNCFYLQSVKLPNNLEEMPMNAFSGCTALREITIPASVKKICATKDDFNESSDELQAFVKEALFDETDNLNSSDFVFPPFSDCSSLKTMNIEDGCSLDERSVLFLTASGGYVFDNSSWRSCGSSTYLFCNSYSMVIYGKASNPTVQAACRLLMPVKFTDSQKAPVYLSPVYPSGNTLFIGSDNYDPGEVSGSPTTTSQEDIPLEDRFRRVNLISRVIVSDDISLVDSNIIKDGTIGRYVDIYIPKGTKVTSEINESYTVKFYSEDQDGTLVDEDGNKIPI